MIVFDPGSAAEPLPPDAVIIGTMERGLIDMGTELGDQAKEVMNGINQVQFKQLSDESHQDRCSASSGSPTMYSDTKTGRSASSPRRCWDSQR